MSLLNGSRHSQKVSPARIDKATGSQSEASMDSKATLQPLSRNDTTGADSKTSTALCLLTLTAFAGAVFYAHRTPRIPRGIVPVQNLDLRRYMGRWYEVARIDHVFERGLQRTQAEYTQRPNGSVWVTNRGYHPLRNEWRIAHGKARPSIAPDIAALKVSFFGPFYSGYHVVALDEDYRWAMVIGSTLEYFWILSRTPSLPPGIKERLMHQAQQLGVPTEKVLWVHQDGVNPTGSYK